MAASKKTKKPAPWTPPTSGDNYMIMPTIYCLYNMLDIKLPPSEKWNLVIEQHGINEEFSTGLLGKTGFQLLEIVGKTYQKVEERRPPKVTKLKDGEEEFTPFFGDIFCMENVNIDMNSKTVSIRLG